MILSRVPEYLITYQNNGVQVLPKKHPSARRRKSVPVPCELVELLKENIASELLPNSIKLVYLFKVPRPSVELAIEYFKVMQSIEGTDDERIMVSLLVAHKVNHDLIIKNSMWSKYAEIETLRITELERYLLQELNFEVFITGY